MAKVDIVLNTLSKTRNSVASQLIELQRNANILRKDLKDLEDAIGSCIVDLALIESSILKLEEPAKVSKKKEK